MRWLVSKKNGFEMRRRTTLSGKGIVRVEQEFAGDNPDAVIATAHSWFVSVVRVKHGKAEVVDGNGPRTLPMSFVLYVPPGALVRMPVRGGVWQTVGWGGVGLPEGAPSGAVVRAFAGETPPDAASLFAALRGADGVCSVDADRGCPPDIVRRRATLVDAVYRPLPVGRVVRRHGGAASVFSRAFKQAYGISPRTYCQRVRIHDAVMLLLTGASIATVAFDVGFGDVSHFYRQFRRVTGSAPGRYRPDPVS